MRRAAAGLPPSKSLLRNIMRDSVSTAFACQDVGVKEVEEGIWMVSSMEYDLGYIDLEEKILQPCHKAFGSKV
jgi:hypothetical protein